MVHHGGGHWGGGGHHGGGHWGGGGHHGGGHWGGGHNWGYPWTEVSGYFYPSYKYEQLIARLNEIETRLQLTNDPEEVSQLISTAKQIRFILGYDLA
jgi:hypothetical protein